MASTAPLGLLPWRSPTPRGVPPSAASSPRLCPSAPPPPPGSARRCLLPPEPPPAGGLPPDPPPAAASPWIHPRPPRTHPLPLRPPPAPTHAAATPRLHPPSSSPPWIHPPPPPLSVAKHGHVTSIKKDPPFLDEMRPLSCPVPSPDPNPDASPPQAPMTPRAPPPRHHPPHLLLAEAVASWHPFQKKPCLSDRSTAPPSSAHLPDAETPTAAPSGGGSGGSLRWLGLRKRRRRGAGSRSVSGRSSDRRRSGTCSDFHFTCGAGGGGATDSSGEMWASDVGEVRMRDVPMAPEFGPGPVGTAGAGAGAIGAVPEAAAAESGYGSEPGYRGDVELGYGDEIDEEEDDGKQQLFWGGVIGDMSKMGINDNKFGEQKSHHRCRRKKHDVKMLIP